MENEQVSQSSYGKRPLWQWVLIYLVIGGVIYAAVYYFVLKPGGSSYNGSTATPSATYP